MNWIQIVFLREDSQEEQKIDELARGCELNSNCIFTWGFTRKMNLFQTMLWLWIEFKLYFYVRIHKLSSCLDFLNHVVNWIQIVFLREDSQGWNAWICKVKSCELNSNCIFTWGFTRNSQNRNSGTKLWIEFKLYFYVRIHKNITYALPFLYVVNWIQIVFLREDSQAV